MSSTLVIIYLLQMNITFFIKILNILQQKFISFSTFTEPTDITGSQEDFIFYFL